MTEAICGKCGHIFWACIALNITQCPKCGSNRAYVAIRTRDRTEEDKSDEG